MPHMPFLPPRLGKKWVLNDSQLRSIVKTLCWRVTGSGATFLISWLISGSWTVAGSIAVIQIMANTVLYYLHERAWNHVTWGRINTHAKEIDQ
jgi:uncharacterized membrane protein